MKILFSMLHFGFLRNFESVVQQLAARGHQVSLLADEPESFGGEYLADSLSALPGVRRGWAPSYQGERWFPVARKLRHGLDYLRFLDAAYADFPKLRGRAAERAPRGLTGLMRLPGMSGVAGRRALMKGLGALDASLPRCAGMDRFLAEERPDVALFASVTNPRAPQLDHLRSARALGIPTGVCVYSWDHLSSKALIRAVPDRVFVWNETQKREAVDLHGLPAGRVVVTGAQVYDQWFGRAPSRPRDAFVAAVGLPADRPFLLYVCSALTPDPNESRFVRRWVEAIRACSTPGLREAGVLIRPHPERVREWERFDRTGLGPLVIAGQYPVTTSAKADYFDALAHSAAVIGLVTSAFLEAAIAGRPVLTIVPEEFRLHQEGMLHFRYLLDVGGGLLDVSRDLEEHVRHLERILAGDRSFEARQRRFLEAFVRPQGIDVPATPAFVEAVEALGALRPAAAAESVPGWRRALVSGLVSASGGWLQPALLDAREAAERRARDFEVRRHRREYDEKWRRHRRRKFVGRLQWAWKRARGAAGGEAPGSQDQQDR
jgi:hypothetical protein